MSQGNWTRRDVLVGGGAMLAAGSIGAPAEAQEKAEAGDPLFKLGTVTYNVPKDWDLNTILKILPQAGVRGIEFRTTHAHGVEPSLSPTQRAEVRQKAADAGLTLWGLGSTCEFHSPDPAVVRENIQTCRQFVGLAKDLGIRGVKVRPNGLQPNVPPDKTLEQIGTALKECGNFAQANGVEIWVEVHGKDTQEPANIRKIMDYCGHKSVGICWNSNPTDVKNGSVRESFELLKPFLMSCHINNLWGPYPYRELFSLFRQAKYDRFTLCEVATAVKPEDGLVFFQCYHGLWKELARG